MFPNPAYNFSAKILIFRGKRATNREQKLCEYSRFKQVIRKSPEVTFRYEYF